MASQPPAGTQIMFKFLAKRLAIVAPTLVAISVISFMLIELPPGDYLTTYTSALEARGGVVLQEEIENLRQRYGLDQPLLVRYVRWISGVVLHGDLGYSFQFRRPVAAILSERLPLTILVALAAILFSWVVALPMGILSAMKKHSPLDYMVTFVGFLGLAIPNFLFALLLMYFSARYLGTSVGGLFSAEYQGAPWSAAKFGNLLAHLWIPTLIIGTAGTAGLIRELRANLLDELGKPYVEMGRAKGLHPLRLVLKYPVRIALNPFVSGIAFLLPAIFSGEAIVAIVLNLPTVGPVLLDSLLSQDTYLTGAIVMMLALLTVLGVLLSDVLLAALDPRIRYA